MEQPSFPKKQLVKQVTWRHNDTALHVAVRAGNLEEVKQILSGVSVPVSDSRGSGVASDRVVIDVGNTKFQSDLIAAHNDLGETALYVAADSGQTEIVKELLQYADLEAAGLKTQSGYDALHTAAKHGYLDIVTALLSFCPALSTTNDISNATPLYSAAVQGHLDVVNALLEADEKLIKIARSNGKTALHLAARLGHLEVLKALLSKDPEITARKDNKGQTALHMAVKGKSVDVVDELLRADPSVINIHDKKGNTALHIATRKWRDQIVRELLSYPGVNVNALNRLKETALDIAEKLPCTEFASDIKDALREAGAESAKNINQPRETRELKKTVSDIKHDVHTQLMQTAKTDKRVTGIAKELRKLHREGINNATNSVTVVAVLIAAIAFAAIFTVPGQYNSSGPYAGEAVIVHKVAFQIFFIFDSVALFISLAVVVVQITLVAWETKAQRQVVFVINKLMWLASVCTSVAFIALAHIVVGHHAKWMAITVTAIGGSIMMATLATMCYFVVRHQMRKYKDRSQRKIRRSSRSRSYSGSIFSEYSDSDMFKSEHEKIYAL
eukprot:Gb_12977 [translate_table: standard]